MKTIGRPSDLQRSRLLAAMAEVAGEGGYAAATVTAVCERAGLSRQTFYQRFDSREACFLAVLDEAYDQCVALIVEAFEAAETWPEGLREAFAALLSLFDDRPSLARLWMVESIAAGPWALEHRERRILELTETVVEYWGELPAADGSHPMAPLAIMGAVLSAIQRHLATGAREPLINLLGPLMGIATNPFLHPAGVAAEVRRGERLASEIAAGARRPTGVGDKERPSIPTRLLDSRAHRARACLLHLSVNPGASNRQIADAAGISSHTQISGLMARLAGMGLAEKESTRPGGPNAWRLTVEGQAAAAALC